MVLAARSLSSDRIAALELRKPPWRSRIELKRAQAANLTFPAIPVGIFITPTSDYQHQQGHRPHSRRPLLDAHRWYARTRESDRITLLYRSECTEVKFARPRELLEPPIQPSKNASSPLQQCSLARQRRKSSLNGLSHFPTTTHMCRAEHPFLLVKRQVRVLWSVVWSFVRWMYFGPLDVLSSDFRPLTLLPLLPSLPSTAFLLPSTAFEGGVYCLRRWCQLPRRW
jgi:hypothetical protein